MRFIDAFNALVGETLPPPEPEQAMRYWYACKDNEVLDGQPRDTGRPFAAAASGVPGIEGLSVDVNSDLPPPAGFPYPDTGV